MATGVLKRAWDKINDLWVEWKVADGAAYVLEQSPKSPRKLVSQWIVGDDTPTTFTVVDGDLSDWIDLSKIDRTHATIYLIVAGTNNFTLNVKVSHDGGATTLMTISNPLGVALAAGTMYALKLDDADLAFAPYIKLNASGTVATPTLRAVLVAQRAEV